MTTAEKRKWKQELKNACIAILEKRIANATQAMQQAQESANNESKSSAGDKHETSRAMSQADSEMNAKQLAEAIRDLQVINKLNTDVLYNHVCLGVVVICKENSFFISLGLGSTDVDKHKVILLSANAPIARLLDQKKAKDTFVFNGKETEILDVF